MSNSCITKDQIFYSVEKMEKEKLKISNLIKEDLKKNIAKYIVQAIIFCLFFIVCIFLFGFSYSTGKVTGALVEPVTENVLSRLSPEIKEINNKLDGIIDKQERTEQFNIAMDKIEIDKYYIQANDKSINLNSAHQKKLNAYFYNIPDSLRDPETTRKYNFVDNFITMKTMQKIE